MIDANFSVFDFFYIQSNSLSTETKAASPYTNPALRERIKDRVMAGSQGGRPGQWSARKAQLVAARYRAAGGGYKKGKKPTKAQRSLRKWTGEKWRTSDNKPALRGGRMRRYLPDKVWDRLTPAQRRATNAKKIRGDRAGRQFVANTEVAARRSRAVRMRSKALGKPIGGISDFDGDGDGFLTGPDGQDNIPAPVAAVARTVTDAAKPRLGGEDSRPRGGKLPPPKAGTRVRGSQTWGGVFALRRMDRDKQIAVMKHIMKTRLMLNGKRQPSRRQTNAELAEKFGFINTEVGLQSLTLSARSALEFAKEGKWGDRKITESFLQELLAREQARPRPRFTDDFPWSATIRAAYEVLGKEIPKTLDDWEPPARKPDVDAETPAAARSREFLRSLETRLNIPDEQPARNRRLRELRDSLMRVGNVIPQSLRDEIANLDKPSDEDGPTNKKKDYRLDIVEKALGRPIGGISEVDGDGDGFVTGPTGEDNVPAPATAAVRGAVNAAASAKKPSTRPKGSAQAPSSDSRTGKVSEIIGKIGKRMIGLSEPTKKKNLKSGELFPIVAADARQIVLSVRNNPRVMGLLMARYSTAKYPDDHLKMLEAAEKAVRTRKPNLMMRDPDVKEVIQTANIAQLAEDMKALGVDEEMAKRVLEKVVVSEHGSLAWKTKQERVAAGQAFAADNGVEAPLWTHVLAGALRDSWAESSNDHQETSLAMQEIAANLMASLGESRPFVKAEDVISKEENARSAKGVAKLLADAEVRNVMETFLSSQYARTQEMFEHHGIETVELHRGMDHVEIAKAIRAEHKEKVDAMVSDLREDVQKAAGDEYAEFLSVDAELTKFEKDLKSRIMRSDEERDAAQNRLAMLRAQRTNLIRKIRDKTRPVIEDHVARFRKFEKENGLDDFDAAMRPLSSWTSDAMMGNYFSIIGGEERMLPQPIVLTSTLDRKEILSTVLNGIGAIQEDEIVTMTPIAKSSARVGPLGKIEERPQYGQQEILGSTRGMSIVSLIEDLDKHLKFFKGFENLNMPILNMMQRWGDR